MRVRFPIVLLMLGGLLVPLARGQAHGESIFGNANTNASSVAVAMPVNALETPAFAALANLTNGALVGFDCLAGFHFLLTQDLELNTNRAAWADAQVNAMIPEKVRALEGREVSVEGFMIPMVYEKDKVTEFLLARDPMGCCYSTVPLMDQFVKVRVKSPGVKEMIYYPAHARGILHVGAERQDGVLTSIYRMDGLSVEKGPEE
jgi:hypothetical protein